jgi:transcriptional regulator
LHRVIREHPLGILILKGADGLDANHLPFELHAEQEQAVLLAHVARANNLWQEAQDGDEALVVFRAATAYISPNWYPSKHEFQKRGDTLTASAMRETLDPNA